MTKDLTLGFHGAARTVTGSCMEFCHDGKRLLVDCGLFQGSRTLETLNRAPFTFDAGEVDAVILTHAHIDHSGLLPKLVADGFDGPIWCTRPTADLLEFMLADAGRIQETEAARRNRRRDRAGEAEFVPIYTEQDALAAWRQAQTTELETWFEPIPGFRARFWNAGHILGAASVELDIAGTHILCSGDLGPEHKAFYPDPESPAGFDHVICESTYGDRRREHLTIAERRTSLEAEIKAALTLGGNLIIPVFALERTQELLLDIAALIDAKRIASVPVFIDSPLASQATSVFDKYAGSLEDTGGADVFRHTAFHFVDSVQESIRLNTVSGAIIMAASGMCEAGRIRHHLKHNLFRRESTILFVGFQAQGSLGRVILEGAKRVRISGEDIVVRAQVRHIDTYSAHADQDDLLAWMEARRPIAGSLFLSHGEANSIEALRRLAQSRDVSASIVAPELGDVYRLSHNAPAARIKTGDPVLQQAVGRDWQNSYAAFATSLKRELADIKDAANRQQAIEDMRKILESYKQAQRTRSTRRHADHQSG
ncbi:MBL fold metallo-hydrolase RNA specificity domain-containing protein [Sphingobium nicotianae]|uniref:MBL fold metallo-hydrolase n=1 Tax=Sphingobium nicotianae TaxID=2782607 RepID=A0A9X1DEE7_9SPHN|nr:MBL fold metallo-hydrolase [Sphingobium nicotianae]MBT2188364.1 MBL fold metallo-hydrolase [Sphingobium nicotianae]